LSPLAAVYGARLDPWTGAGAGAVGTFMVISS
jgi:hypothetical protein